MLMAKGNVGEALTSYEASFAMARQVASAAPDNDDLQRDLAYSHAKVGDAHRAAGNLNQRSSGMKRRTRSLIA